MNNRPQEEVKHNFNYINSQIELELEKQRNRLTLDSSVRWETYSKAFAILIVAIGLTYFIYALAEYWLKKPAVTESTVTTISNNIPAEVTSDSGGRGNVSVNFTVFRSEFTEQGESVVTGYNYTPDQVDFPVSQYCYIRKFIDVNKSEQISVGDVEGDSSPNWVNDLPQSQIQLARNHCVFITR